MESILTSIKMLLGIAEDYDCFDAEIVMHINSVFMKLNQLGVGPSETFSIEDETSTWTDFTPDIGKIEAIKSYMHHEVKLLFDSGSMSSAVLNSTKEIANELAWRLNIASESSKP